MMPKEELLQYIHKTADMGVAGLEDMLPKTEDQELFSTLEKQKTQYEKVRQEARRLLERQGESVNDASAMAKLSANMMSAGKLLFDASPEKIAEMTIQGTTMGVTKTIQHLRDYDGNEAVPVAYRHLSLERKNSASAPGPTCAPVTGSYFTVRNWAFGQDSRISPSSVSASSLQSACAMPISCFSLGSIFCRSASAR